jgi:hypothetical protein
MFRLVALVRTDVSEELSASIIRVTRIGELGMLAVTTNCCHLDGTLSSSETSVLTTATRCNIPEDITLLNDHCENLKSSTPKQAIYIRAITTFLATLNVQGTTDV